MSLSHLATTTPIITSAYSSNNPLRRRQRTTNSSRIQPVHHHVTKLVTHISCEQKKQSSNHKSDRNVIIDRRNMLLGLGGIYGATTTMGNQAVGEPIKPPDLTKCQLATDEVSKEKVDCCPPYTNVNIVDFKPPLDEPLRIRKPAHEYNCDDIAKFEDAIAKMKALPDDDPRSYKQQATIHCTFCNGAFNQLGTEVLLQVHGRWFFFPWHRYYLYFFERILGELIGDPTFTIPYWSWDTPEGMCMPKMYLNESSPLFDGTRDENHYSSVFNYKYAYGQPNPTPSEIDDVIKDNLSQLDGIFSEDAIERNPALFMGNPLRAGEAVDDESIGNPSGGSLEQLHNIIHQWVGTTTWPYHNMGNFYTTARDPIFYALHGNVDRMWDIYDGFRGHKPAFKDPDWLDSEFIFCDENRQVVKVKVKDCLQPEQLGYTYTKEEFRWKDIGRKSRKLKAAGKTRSAGDSIKLVPVSEFGSSPRTLTETIQVLVQRPKTSRSKADKDDASEVLHIKGIQVAHESAARFDVYITKPMEGVLVGPDHGEYAGGFAKIPHSHHHRDHSHKSKSSLELGITELLENIEAEDSKKLVVTLVPRHGDVTIDGVDVELSLVDDDEYEVAGFCQNECSEES